MLVAIIGGGAAGMMAAYSAGSYGAQTVILEQNEKLAKKVFISGKGRCNLTNDSSINEHIENVMTNPRFLFSAYKALSAQEMMSLVENAGTPLKTERGNRVFPVSDKSSDIIHALTKLVKSVNCDVKLNEKVTKIIKNGDKFTICYGNNQEIIADKVIIATGGVTYKATGSTGDGYKFASKFGHSIIDPKPALVGLKANVPVELAGLSLKNVSTTIKEKGKKLYSEFGEMLFTHTGVSGPIVLTLSSKINKKNLSDLSLEIDLKPALDMQVLDARLVREFSANQNKFIKTIMPSLMPQSLSQTVLKQAKINENTPCQAITKEMRERLATVIKHLCFNITGFEEFNGAIVTSGGVAVNEINPKDMQSKFVKGLYFAGEVIDVDALTGGFNLQIAFSTGYLAGMSAANDLL